MSLQLKPIKNEHFDKHESHVLNVTTPRDPATVTQCASLFESQLTFHHKATLETNDFTSVLL